MNFKRVLQLSKTEMEYRISTLERKIAQSDNGHVVLFTQMYINELREAVKIINETLDLIPEEVEGETLTHKSERIVLQSACWPHSGKQFEVWENGACIFKTNSLAEAREKTNKSIQDVHVFSVKKSLTEDAFYSWLSSLSPSKHIRFGQDFCNRFIEGSWPELYYETDSDKAWKLISDVLPF